MNDSDSDDDVEVKKEDGPDSEDDVDQDQHAVGLWNRRGASLPGRSGGTQSTPNSRHTYRSSPGR